MAPSGQSPADAADERTYQPRPASERALRGLTTWLTGPVETAVIAGAPGAGTTFVLRRFEAQERERRTVLFSPFLHIEAEELESWLDGLARASGFGSLEAWLAPAPNAPLLLADEAHTAAPAALEALARLRAARAPQLRVCLGGCAGPALEKAAQCVAGAGLLVLELPPWSAEDLRALARALCAVVPADPAALVAGAEGSPGLLRLSWSEIRDRPPLPAAAEPAAALEPATPTPRARPAEHPPVAVTPTAPPPVARALEPAPPPRAHPVEHRPAAPPRARPIEHPPATVAPAAPAPAAAAREPAPPRARPAEHPPAATVATTPPLVAPALESTPPPRARPIELRPTAVAPAPPLRAAPALEPAPPPRARPAEHPPAAVATVDPAPPNPARTVQPPAAAVAPPRRRRARVPWFHAAALAVGFVLGLAGGWQGWEEREPAVREPAPEVPALAPVSTAPPVLPVAAPARHDVQVNARPWAWIRIDGQAVGVTPLVQHGLAAGPHEFEATFPDGRQQRRTVEVGPDSRFVSFAD
jgi:hypothetical protein